ncbi:NAD(P)H-binding protein [Quadrisphaera sp. KR29]|uniref:NAD(P)H-binding protein n=1 Tax=Quadrisphaera sp. KR29 TaxID=3461391 RepID=UPI0040451686
MTVSSSPVLVLGATGDVGGEVVRLLVAAGEQVHALHRSPEQAQGLAAAGARPVLARLGQREEVAAALRDVRRVLLLTPPVPHQLELDRQVVELAAQERLEHVVRISASDSHLRSPVPWARAHAHADHLLAATDLPWTVLRPSAFLQNITRQSPTVRRGVLPHTAGRGAVSWVDARDVAAVAAAVFADGPQAHLRATYFLTGPQSLSYGEVAERLTAGLGRRVRAVALPKAVYRLALRAGGVDAFTAAGLGAQFADVVRHQVDVDVTGEVARLTGRPPRDLDTWVRENRDQLV